MSPNIPCQKKIAQELLQIIQSIPEEAPQHDHMLFPKKWKTIFQKPVDLRLGKPLSGDLQFSCQTEQILPRRWNAFERQYRSAEAELIERIYQSCQEQKPEDWIGQEVDRNSFYSPFDHQSSEKQARYEQILDGLHIKGFVSKPTKDYQFDIEVIGIKIGNKTMDLPLRYRDFKEMYACLQKDRKIDTKPTVEKYGKVQPIVFLCGQAHDLYVPKHQSTEQGGNPATQRYFELLKETTYREITPYHIWYVAGEKKESGEITPFFFGDISAWVTNFVKGMPLGIIHNERDFLVPSETLTKGEKFTLSYQLSDWTREYSRFIPS